MSHALHQLTLAAAQKKLQSGEVTSVALTEAVLNRIAATDDKIFSYVHVAKEVALEMAQQADQKLKSGEKNLPLLGIPIALKDIFLTQNMPTTCASKILKGFMAPYNATVVEKLKASGAVFTGKTNMDEFAMGSSTENSAWGVTHNPWDLTRIPGGSSGGSATAVAAEQAFGSLGTDTGGSIRQPAALCGIVGLKPTYGRVSRYGVIAFASSLDQVGPFAKTVEDLAPILQTIAGHDPLDSTSAKVPVPDYSAFLARDLQGIKIGLPKEYFQEGLDPQIKTAILAAAEHMQKNGAELVHVELPHTRYAVTTYYIIAPAEASSNLARYDGVRYGLRVEGKNLEEMYSLSRSAGFGAEVKRRIMLGTYVLSSGYYDAYYLKAMKARTVIKKDFEEAFKKCHVLLTPTSPTVAFKIGEKTADPLQMYLSDIYTIPVNMAGLCGMSLPCGFSTDNLPIGMQLIAPPFEEGSLLQVGNAYERISPWHERRPSL